MKNSEIAEIFNNIADILEIKGDNPFRIKAYRKAALTIEDLQETLAELASSGRLDSLPGIGKDLAGKINEFISTGRVAFYDELKKSVPEGIIELMEIPGIGPKTARLLSDKFGVKNIKDLKKKAASGKIKEIAGVKEKKVRNILKGIEFIEKAGEKMTLDVATRISTRIIEQLKRSGSVKRVISAGSLRRMRETVRDIDILATSTSPGAVAGIFTGLKSVKQVLAHGPTKASVITEDEIQVDLRVVKEREFGSALLYFTGSKAHNIALRRMALKKGMTINEYGIFRRKGKRKLAGADEKGIYRTLGMQYVEPELREDTGEIKAALENALPDLVQLDDIRGDLHIHTKESDGTLTLDEIVAEGRRRRYEYMVITDHSQSLGIAHGLKEKYLLKRVDKIRKLNGRLKDICLLAGSEVDILADGRLDYPDSVLKQLDFVIAAVHSGFAQARKAMTTRVLRAMDNRFVNMLAHPTGRLLGERPAYGIDLEAVLQKALETNTAIEINSHPERLDLDDVHARRAKELGVMIGIATDTHTRDQFDNMAFGISVARRGWLEKKNVLNTLGLKGFLKKIRK